MSPVKKPKISKADQIGCMHRRVRIHELRKKGASTDPTKTHIYESDLEAMLTYYRKSNTDENPIEIKYLESYIRAAKRFETKKMHASASHNAAKIATALSGSAVVGLMTAITLPAAPILVATSAVIALFASWAVASKATHDSSKTEKHLESTD